MKKVISLLVILTMMVTALLTGCGSSSSSGSGTELKLWTFVGLHGNFYKDAAKRWNKAHPNEKINLKVTTYPYADMHNKLLVALQSGVGAPDISDVELGQFPNFLKGTPQIANLSDLVSADKDKFVQSRFKLYSKDGKLYGLDFHVGATVAFYNKDICAQAGVDPTKIKTWDDFEAAGKTIKAKTGKLMCYVSQTATWEFTLMTAQKGSDVFDENGNVTLDNQTNIDILKKLHDMIYVDKIAAVSPGGQVDTEEGYGAVNKGKVAAVVMPFWYTSRFLENMPDLKGKMLVTAPPQFTAEQGGKYMTAGLGGTGTVIPSQGKNIKLAKKFLQFAKETKEASIKIWEQLGFDPPRWDAWNEISSNMKDSKYTEYFANGKDLFKVLVPMKDSVNIQRSTSLSPTANDLLNTQAFYKVLQKNTQDPATALKAAANELRKKGKAN